MSSREGSNFHVWTRFKMKLNRALSTARSKQLQNTPLYNPVSHCDSQVIRVRLFTLGLIDNYEHKLIYSYLFIDTWAVILAQRLDNAAALPPTFSGLNRSSSIAKLQLDITPPQKREGQICNLRLSPFVRLSCQFFFGRSECN